MSDWNFSYPPNLGVFAMGEVLDHPSLLARVVHDVVGDWQFLDEQDVGFREPKLVCLEHMVGIEPSIAQLADLPLGWCASRPNPQSAWERGPMFPLDWEDLVSEAIDYTQQCQARLESEFHLGQWERYDFDQESAQFTFSSQGVERVRADLSFVGTLSLTTDTWLWSWANDGILDQAKRDIEWLEAFGSENDLKRLIESKCAADETDAWELTSVACFLLQAQGVYRAPNDELYAFLLLHDVRWVA